MVVGVGSAARGFCLRANLRRPYQLAEIRYGERGRATLTSGGGGSYSSTNGLGEVLPCDIS